MSLGIDYSFSRPHLDQVVNCGITFVGRYVSGTASAKDLTRTEVDDLLERGLSIVTFGESSGQRALGGQATGIMDAVTMRGQAISIGMPRVRPIFYTVDFYPELEQFPVIEDYFRGIASREQAGSIGVYASYDVCRYLHQLGLVQYMCQTAAWSGGLWYEPAQLRQVENNIDMFGASIDRLTSMSADFGQWPFVTAPPAPPQEDPMGLTAGTFPAGRRQHTIPVTVGASSATQALAWLRLRTAFGDLDDVLVVFETDTAAVMGTESIPKISGNTSWGQQIPSGTTGVNVSWASETPAADAQDGLVSVGWSIEYTSK